MIKITKSPGQWEDFMTIIGKKYEITKYTFNPEFDFPEKPHYHPDAIEWVFAERGDFEITVNGETEKLNLNRDPRIITILPGEIHFLKPLSFMRYLTAKDVPGETIYV